MPGMNGRDLADQIKSLRPGIRCLFMSGYSGDTIGYSAALPQELHFIQKLFTIIDLAAKMAEVMG